MGHHHQKSDLHEHIVWILEETGEDDPFEAVRIKARSVIALFHQTFGESPPFDMKAMASLRGLHWSEDDPRFSADSEIAPESDGRVTLRVNKDRPLCRQRFSIGHEIGHTLFPDYRSAVRCRKANDRVWADSSDLLETLCDVAASELMFPSPWFSDRISTMAVSADALAGLADDYEASREATVRRFVELQSHPFVAVFFSWKLKPIEKREVAARARMKPLFPGLEAPQPVPLLRVDYRIANDAFASGFADFIPKDKSIPCEGPIYDASLTQTPQDGIQRLDFGRLDCDFQIHALPIYTPDDAVGPDGASCVVAVLRPLP